MPEHNSTFNNPPSNYRQKTTMDYIYDEEFISLINGVSDSIKELYKNNRGNNNNIKLTAECIDEQTLFSKSSVNDILVYLNQMNKTKFNSFSTHQNQGDRFLRDKLRMISERMLKISELKSALLTGIREGEGFFREFYEEAKALFKKMKIIRTENIERLNARRRERDVNNFTQYNSIFKGRNFRTLSQSPPRNNYTSHTEGNYDNYNLNSNMASKRSNKIPNSSNLNQFLNVPNKTANNTLPPSVSELYNNYISLRSKYNNIIKQNKLSRSLDKETKKQVFNISQNNNNNNNSEETIEMAKKVSDFLLRMKELQESIKKKGENIKELKVNFEIKKRELQNLVNSFLTKDNKKDSKKDINPVISNKIKELQEEINKYKKEKEENMKILDEIKAKNSNLSQIETQQKIVIQGLTTSNSLKDSKIQDLTNTLSSFRLFEAETKTLKAENSKLRKQVEDYNTNLINICNSNEGIIREKDKIIKNLNVNIEELNKQVNVLNEEIAKKLDNKNSIVLNEEINSLKSRISTLDSQSQSLNKENKSLKNSMGSLREEFLLTKEALEETKITLGEIEEEAKKDIETLQKKNKEMNEIKEEYNQKINNKNYKEKKSENLQENFCTFFASLEEDEKNYRALLADMKNILGEAEEKEDV